MKKYSRLLSLIIVFVIIAGNTIFAQNQRNCGTTKYMQYEMLKNPFLKQKMQKQELAIQQWIKNSKSSKSIINIPVVFHVIYNSNNTNISDAQIASQLKILNDDYRLRNSDTSGIPAMFKSLAADIEIEFCTAHQDPDGNWTDGITRTHTTKTTFDMGPNEAKYTSKGGHDIWDASKYLNIWIVPQIIDGVQSGILGYAQMPGGNPATDGVVIGYNYIGNIGTVSHPFNKGRTATHEIGHWFRLHHIWGDDWNACTGTDYVDDTPNQGGQNYGCPTHPSPSCSNNGDMFNNYMDYSDDACMNMFTKGQKARMLAAINTSRASLISSGRCQINSLKEGHNIFNFDVYPNPASKKITIKANQTLINCNILVLDITGKIILQKINCTISDNIKIDTDNLADGVYIIKITSSKKTQLKKLIIQH